MFWLANISLFIGAVLAAQGMLREKYPKFSGRIDTMNQLKNLVGTFLFFLGLSGLIDLIFYPYDLFTRVLSGLLMMIIGYVQGYEQLTKLRDLFGFKWNMERLYHRWSPYQEFLGVIGLIAVGINLLKYFNIIH